MIIIKIQVDLCRHMLTHLLMRWTNIWCEIFSKSIAILLYIFG